MNKQFSFRSLLCAFSHPWMALELIRDSPRDSHGKMLWPQEKIPVLTGKERFSWKKFSAFQKGLFVRASHVWGLGWPHYLLCPVPPSAPASQLLWGSYPMQHPDTLIHFLRKLAYWNKATNIQNLGELAVPQFPFANSLGFLFSYLNFLKPDIISFDKTLNENRKCLLFSQKGSSGWRKWGKP